MPKWSSADDDDDCVDVDDDEFDEDDDCEDEDEDELVGCAWVLDDELLEWLWSAAVDSEVLDCEDSEVVL